MGDDFSRMETWVIRVGVFLVFLVTFGEYVYGKVSPVLERLWP